jgi:hypothetical protein
MNMPRSLDIDSQESLLVNLSVSEEANEEPKQPHAVGSSHSRPISSHNEKHLSERRLSSSELEM